MKNLSSVILSFISIVFWSCSDYGEPKLEGCTDSGACNYSNENTHDDDSCTYPEPNYDCEGNCITAVDACNICGGETDNVSDCCQEGQILDCTGTCGGDAVVDCIGDCNGSAVEDACQVCGGNGSTCNISYSLTIQPIFNANCTGCHGNSGGLTLTSYNELMENDVIDPGNSSTSKLIKILKGTSGTQMPLDENPLDDATINLIEIWIDEGALDN